MNRNKLKTYAPQARRDFIRAVTDRAALFGITKDGAEKAVEQGDVVVIGGRAYPRSVAAQRKRLVERIGQQGFDPVMEAVAYTWFNRFVAIRYMELHGYLDHGFRVLSSVGSGQPAAGSEEGHPARRPRPAAYSQPEILEHAEEVSLPGLRREAVIDLKLAGNKEAELYRMLLIAQCNALHDALPFLFERIDDETELLLPDHLLQTDSLIRTLVTSIDEEDWREVEIIGWLYQFYISERKDEVIGKVVASKDIPAATQLFTPNWIVKYLVQNTLGRQWLEHHPNSPLKAKMEYYIEPAEQTPEVQAQLQQLIEQRTRANRGLTADCPLPTADYSLNPEELTLLDPACGSGHILVEAYDLFRAIYQERGYRARDIPRLILSKNLFGLEIDDRAAQLAAFALMMKARADDRRIFDSEAKPNVVSMQQAEGGRQQAEEIAYALESAAGFEVGSRQQADSSSLPSAICHLPADLHTAICHLHTLFENAKTFGSLIQVPPALAQRLPLIEQRCREAARQTNEIASGTAARFLPVVEQAQSLARQYDCVVANPPYMGSKYYSPTLKAFVNKHYKAAKGDLCTAFIDRGVAFTKQSGLMSMITMQSWMFLSSFQDFRTTLMQARTMRAMIHLGPHAFPEIGGQVVQVTAFVVNPQTMPEYRGSYRRLIEGQSHEKEQRFHTAKTFTPSNADFDKIPGSPVAYWVSEVVMTAYARKLFLSDVIDTRIAMATGDNNRFVRCWHEVISNGVAFPSLHLASVESLKWFVCNKGGEYRKWYGNNVFVVNWANNGAEILNFSDALSGRIRSHNYNGEFAFRESATWNAVSSSEYGFRFSPAGFMFVTPGSSAFSKSTREVLLEAIGQLCSKVTPLFLQALSSTLNIEAGSVANLPRLQVCAEAGKFASECIAIARLDWDSSEASWDFATLPVLQHKLATLQQSQEAADAECLARFARMKQLEEENNRLFIEAYGLQDELSPEVPDDQITLYRPDRAEDIKRLLSYAIGCMMGRYSLDKPGLIYAHGPDGGRQWAECSKDLPYKTFIPDPDAIVPVLENDWGFKDDACTRIIEFVKTVWPNDPNAIEFIEESLGTTIRGYLAKGFFKHHLTMYKRRPIYWLFSSGKQRAFQCLVYLHRYHEGTLSRMRTEYVIPLQGKIAARIEHLAGDIAAATSTAQRKKLEKERESLLKQQVELHAFDEKLRHLADQRITLDLDDGVKVNYAKFGDLLAEVRAVTGGNEEE